jgi:hypothetical protein
MNLVQSADGTGIAFEAAAQGVEMRRLAAYEPPYTGAVCPGSEFGQHLDALVAEGRREEAAEQWLAMTGIPVEIIESI